MSNHRLTLSREWIGSGGIVNLIGNNPSKACTEFEDPTSRRFMGFAKRWGFRGYVATNLWSFKATDPADLQWAANQSIALAIGEGNDEELLKQAAAADLVVCCWGDLGIFMKRAAAVCEMLRAHDLHCIRLTAAGNPVHPVREAYTDAPVLWRKAARS